jgi:DNA uptake protein ComE-like DNA-binding protein
MTNEDLTTIPNIGPTKAAALKAAGFETTDEADERKGEFAAGM